MRQRFFLAVLVLSFTACCPIPVRAPSTVAHGGAAPMPPVFDAARLASERLADEAAYREHILAMRERLLWSHLGEWVVITGGRVFPVNEQHTLVAPAAKMDDAIAAADIELPASLHRFVFRIGEEGDASEFLGGADLRHVLGNGFFVELEMGGVALNGLGPHGSLFAARDGLRTEITVPGPDDRMFVRPEVGPPGVSGCASELFVLSTGFGGTAVLPPETAAALSLNRWEIPGKITMTAAMQAGGECRRARARFRFPGTSLDFVLPVAIWPE